MNKKNKKNKKNNKPFINKTKINWKSLWCCITLDRKSYKVIKWLLNAVIGLCIIFLDWLNNKNVDWWIKPLFTYWSKYKNPVEWYLHRKELYSVFEALDVVIDLTTLQGWFIFFISVFFSLRNFLLIMETSFLVCWEIKFRNTRTEKYVHIAYLYLEFFFLEICILIVITIIYFKSYK
jgi:hypothetical protein